VDLAEKLVEEAATKSLRVYLLGGGLGVAAAAAKAMKRHYPKLEIKGDEGTKDIKHQFSIFNFQTMIEAINDFNTDILLVAFGAPWQERFVIEHKNELKVRVAMVVGGAFDMWSGKVPRAPLQWRNFGFEWLWRLIHEPWRVKRQLKLITFMGMVGKKLISG
jgi:N-acetylglucosaminyldiphosphoundecaprenol N-acetyl-beta-D-mannosaminyltransferase